MSPSHSWGGNLDWADGIRPEVMPGDAEALALLVAQSARDGMQAVEVGSWAGNGSTRALAEALRPFGGHLYCVDTWQGSANVDHHRKIIARRGSLFPIFAENVRRYGGEDVIRPLRRTSLEAASLFPDASLDLVFLDGDHSYSQVRQDIQAWLPKVRPGGVLCGHDCDARFARLAPGLQAEVCIHGERDTMKNTRHPGPPEMHPGVVRAVHEAFRGKARLWIETLFSTVWSHRKPGRLWAWLREMAGLPYPPVGPGPLQAVEPWPEYCPRTGGLAPPSLAAS
jgi:predicted O-methyltransferase YrrM